MFECGRVLVGHVVELSVAGAFAGWGGCGGCGDGWASLMKVEAVDVCGNDGGGGDCEADGREATGSTARGGHVTTVGRRNEIAFPTIT